MPEQDKPADVLTTAANLRRWSVALRIPSGNFVNEDMIEAAEMLERYASCLVVSPQGRQDQ